MILNLEGIITNLSKDSTVGNHHHHPSAMGEKPPQTPSQYPPNRPQDQNFQHRRGEHQYKHPKVEGRGEVHQSQCGQSRRYLLTGSLFFG